MESRREVKWIILHRHNKVEDYYHTAPHFCTRSFHLIRWNVRKVTRRWQVYVPSHSRHCLQILPPSIGDLGQVHTLHLYGNPYLDRFPLEFGKLRHVSAGGSLKELKYDQGNVKYPPEEIAEQVRLCGLAFWCLCDGNPS